MDQLPCTEWIPCFISYIFDHHTARGNMFLGVLFTRIPLSEPHFLQRVVWLTEKTVIRTFSRKGEMRMQVTNFFQRYILLLSECFLCYKKSRILRLASEEESSPWSPKARVKSCCWSDRILCTLCLSFSSSPFILSRTKLSVKTKIKSMKCKRFSKMVKMLYFCPSVISGTYRTCKGHALRAGGIEPSVVQKKS